jgi:hypothetical protein
MSSLNINSTLLSAQSYGNRPLRGSEGGRGSEIPAAFRQAIARAGDSAGQGTKAPVRAQANGAANNSANTGSDRAAANSQFTGQTSTATGQNGQAPRRPLAPGSLINIVV